MKNVYTNESVVSESFFKLPKGFFSDPLYSSMRLESKVAYALLLDLVPLSIKNNWVNKENQVIVKMSRKKLMEKLSIKGSQKMTHVMKELVDHKLIIYKRVGLTKCNEIYLYPLSGDDYKKKTNKTLPAPTNLEGSQEPISPTRTKSALDDVQDLLEQQIHTDYLKEKYDPSLVDEICNNIHQMFFNTTTRIGQQNKPQAIIRSMLKKLKLHHIEHVIDQFKEASATMKIHSPRRYIQAIIYNSICEADMKIQGNISYHMGC